MRSFLAAALSLVSALALPIPHRAMSTSTDTRVLEYNTVDGYTKFSQAAIGKDDEALVFELQVIPTSDVYSSNITLNSQPLDITWTTSPSDSKQLIARNTSQSLVVPDRLGFPHLVHIIFAGDIAAAPGLPTAYNNVQNIDLTIDSIDGIASRLGFTVVANPAAPHRLVKLATLYEGGTISFDQVNKSSMVDKWESEATASDTFTQHSNDSQEPLDIEAEIETLLLLELEAGELHTAIANKKEAIAKCLKDHRDQVTLRHLLQQCDGLVCAAKVIAQRMCDKVGILTVPKTGGYAKVQSPSSQKLIELDDDSTEKVAGPKVTVTSAYTNTTRTASLTSAAIQPIQVIYPQNALVKALGVVAGLLGLSALFSFIQRKCMSMRKRVEREADREERRNARAYRRAARRAEMRRRWEAFVKAINCFKGEEEPTIKDYEEKRALILQDAMLEQDAETAEKGEIMDAEIRELRHAHEIVASLVRVDEHRFDLITPINDPPPPLVPLPYTPISRSRASTMTLPSYHSESLPDYTSRYQRTEAGSHASSSSSVRSNSVVLSSRANSVIVDGLLYTPNTSEDGTFTGHTTRSFSPESLTGGSSNGSRISRFTPTSSIIEMSPRASEETLRFSWRRSGDTMGGWRRSGDTRRSWDTNDL